MIPAKNAFSAVGVSHAGNTRLTNCQNLFSTSLTLSSTTSSETLKSRHSFGTRGLM